jgi:ribonucleoside-diphosphate reductase alpha chain
MAKEGSTVGGMMDTFATSISLCLQFGVPLEDLVKKFTHQRFEPSGMTSNPDIPFAKSVVDYIFRWLGLTFLEEYRKTNLPNRGQTDAPASGLPARPKTSTSEAVREDAASDAGSAIQASDKEVKRSGGASSGLYVTTSMEDRVLAGASSRAVSIPGAGELLSRRMAPQVERIDQQFSHYQEDAPACDVCGSITVRNGNCYKCYNCGTSLGCS